MGERKCNSLDRHQINNPQDKQILTCLVFFSSHTPPSFPSDVDELVLATLQLQKKTLEINYGYWSYPRKRRVEAAASTRQSAGMLVGWCAEVEGEACALLPGELSGGEAVVMERDFLRFLLLLPVLAFSERELWPLSFVFSSLRFPFLWFQVRVYKYGPNKKN
jgi:hypothetical protein